MSARVSLFAERVASLRFVPAQRTYALRVARAMVHRRWTAAMARGEEVSTVASPCVLHLGTIKRVTRQRVRYRSLAARKPKELRPATESLSVSESDPLPTTTHTKGLS